MVGIAGFVVARLTLALWTLPAVVTYPDSASYGQLSFTGHDERLWAVPLLYRVAGSPTARVIAQSVIAAGCWSYLAVQLGRSLTRPVLAHAAGATVLLLSLTAPVIEWDRALLSESLAISLTVLAFAAALDLARHRDGRRLAVLLVAVGAWGFTRQSQAFLVGLLALPALALILARRSGRRRLWAIGCIGLLVLGGAATLTSLQSGAEPITVTNVAEIAQFRAAGTGELAYLVERGMPLVPALRATPPLVDAGLPVGVADFGDNTVLAALVANPRLSAWARDRGQRTLLGYALTHPARSIGDPLEHAPDLMTMDPGYASGPALPTGVATVLYGAGGLDGTAFSGGGAASSAHPAWLLVAVWMGFMLVVASVIWRRRLAAPAWVAVGGIVFAAGWAIEIWNASAAELPRLLVPAAVLAHVALITLAATAADGLLTSSGPRRAPWWRPRWRSWPHRR